MATFKKAPLDQSRRKQFAPPSEKQVLRTLPEYLANVPKLKYRPNAPVSNWEEFTEALYEATSIKYGLLGNLFKFDEFTAYDEITPPDEEDPVVAENPTFYKSMYQESIKQLASRVAEDNKNKAKLYSELVTLIPRPLFDRIKVADGFEDNVLKKKNIQTLWTMLKSEALGGSASLLPHYQHELAQRFMNIKQSDHESLADFKLRLEHLVASHSSVELPEPTNSMQVLIFLNGANERKYGEAKANLRSLIADGVREYPENIASAYEALEARVTEYPNHYFNRLPGAASYTASDNKMDFQKNCRKVDSSRNVPLRNEKAPNPCKICQRLGMKNRMHWHKDCPNKTEKSFAAAFVSNVAGRHIDRGYAIRLDTQSDRHIFQDIELLSDVCDVQPQIITGIGEHAIRASKSGVFDGIEDVLYAPGAGANLLSFALIRDSYSVSYNEQRDEWRLRTAERDYIFHRVGNHYESTVLPDSALVVSTLPTVQDLEARYTKREISRFRAVGELMAKLAYPSPRRLLDAIKFGTISNVDVSTQDVEGYLQVYGNIPYIKGKMVYRKGAPRPHVPTNRDVKKQQNLHSDLMFVEGETFLLTVSEPLNLTMVKHIPSKGKITLSGALEEMITMYRTRGFDPQVIKTDNEPGMSAGRSEISKLDLLYEPVPPGTHVPIVERMIRTVKDSVRSVLMSLPFSLATTEIPYLVSHCVSRINMMPCSGRVDPTSPYELFTGMKVRGDKELGPKFGSYCEVFRSHDKRSSMNERSVSCICLGSVGNNAGTVRFISLKNGAVLSSNRYKELNGIPDFVIAHMNARAKDQRVGRVAHRGTIHGGVVELYRKPITELNPVNTDDATNVDPFSSHNNPPTASAPTNKAECFHVSFSQAMNKWGDDAVTAATDEIKAMLEKGVFAVSKGEAPNRPIMSFMFFKAKHDAGGVFQKLKARLVAGGHQQDRNQYSDLASPTASTQSIYMIAAIAAKEHRKICTLDIGTAYLNAPMIRDDVQMILDKRTSEILLSLAPEFQACANTRGQCRVILKRALYGCIESALLWYNHIDGTLRAAGFHQNQYDRCCYHSDSTIILVYVDDIFIAAKTDDDCEKVINILTDAYKTVTVHRGTTHSYLGMEFNFNEKGKVLILMERTINEIINGAQVNSKKTPATNSLFTTGGDNLTNADGKSFHSVTAKLLYLAKRARPDILTAVSYLCTRVSSPTDVDFHKLQRILGYLGVTKDLPLTLEVSGSVKLYAYIDASYNIHPDGRSHEGILLTLGSGAIFAKSHKQRLVTRSSTEAELVALADGLTVIQWARNFLNDLGYPQDATTVYQDNKSTVTLANRGYSTSPKTKHINMRYFSMKEIIDRGEVILKYLPTGMMVADFLTKPLQGLVFANLRDKLLGKG